MTPETVARLRTKAMEAVKAAEEAVAVYTKAKAEADRASDGSADPTGVATFDPAAVAKAARL